MIYTGDRTDTDDRLSWFRPLIPITIAVLLGIGLGMIWPGCFGVILIAMGGMALGILFAVFNARSLVLLPMLFLLAGGYLSIQPWLKREMPVNHVGHFVDQGKWQVSGTVVDQPQQVNGRLQFVMRAGRLVQGRTDVAVTGKVRITARGAFPHLQRGDEVLLSGHLHGIRSFCNPGGFDYERFMALQAVRTRLYAQGKSIHRVRSNIWDWRGGLDRGRALLAEQMDLALAHRDPKAVAMLKALVLGDRHILSADIRESFAQAGVSHVLAISGLHIGIVAAAAFFLFFHFLVWIPFIVQRAWVGRAAATLAILPVVGYAFLAGLSPSTQRAMIMATVFLMTYWIGRRHDWFNALAVAALVIVIIMPPALASVSFQLSFAAVMAIMFGMPHLPFDRTTPGASLSRRLVTRAAAFVAVSVFAILGTAPFVMFYFNQICWVGPLTNLVVVPLVGMIIVPLGLMGVVLAPLGEIFSVICWHLAVTGGQGVLWLVDVVAGFPYSAATTVTPSVLEMVLFYLFFIFVFHFQKRPVRYAGMVLVVVAVLDAGYWVHRRYFRQEMVVSVVDVGQGSANVLQLPGGRVVVIDGGGFSDNNSFDVGHQILAPFLWRNKIKRIDLVVLTHPNSDHLNGLLFLLRRFQVGRVWSNHEQVSTMSYRQWDAIIAQRAIDHPSLAQIRQPEVMNGVTLQVLSPPQDFLQQREHDSWRDPNNNSVVVRVHWKKISYLFTGDIMAKSEAELVQRYGAQGLHSTVLVVAHHGSRSSSTQSFLSAVAPEVAIIPVGWQNRFRFPHAQVLQRLEQIGARIHRVDLCGAVELVTNGHDYRIETCRNRCDVIQ